MKRWCLVEHVVLVVNINSYRLKRWALCCVLVRWFKLFTVEFNVNVDVVIGLMRDTQMFKFGWVGWTLFVGLNNWYWWISMLRIWFVQCWRWIWGCSKWYCSLAKFLLMLAFSLECWWICRWLRLDYWATALRVSWFIR